MGYSKRWREFPLSYLMWALGYMIHLLDREGTSRFYDWWEARIIDQ